MLLATPLTGTLRCAKAPTAPSGQARYLRRLSAVREQLPDSRRTFANVTTAVLSEGKLGKSKSRFGWSFRQASFDTGHLDDLEKYFDRMPYDPWLYKDGHKYRTRRLSTVMADPIDPNELIILPKTFLIQSKEVNPLYGGVPRTFDDLEPEIFREPAFRAIWKTFISETGIDPNVEKVMVHQIRTKCSPTMFGDPTPEGIHQDGYSIVGIFCAGRRNIRGAATSLYRSPKDAAPLITKVLQGGDAMIANDKEVYHFTGIVEPEGDQEGSRDVFVLILE